MKVCIVLPSRALIYLFLQFFLTFLLKLSTSATEFSSKLALDIKPEQIISTGLHSLFRLFISERYL